MKHRAKGSTKWSVSDGEAIQMKSIWKNKLKWTDPRSAEREEAAGLDELLRSFGLLVHLRCIVLSSIELCYVGGLTFHMYKSIYNALM